MRKRRFYLLLIGAVVVIGVLVAVVSGPREPEYNGRKLSEWVDDYNRDAWYSSYRKFHSQVAAEEAIKHAGTNALPWLLEWIQYEPPLWRRGLDQTLETLGMD